MNSFEILGLNANVLRAVEKLGYEKPTPIQAEAIPHVLDGKDVLGVAQTGTGKTAAFSLPMVHHLSENRYSGQHRPIRALILTPTRELANQIADNVEEYTTHVNLFSTTIFGGVSQHKQVQKLRRGVDIVVATPGRLLDLHEQGHVNLKHLQYFVLDEADTMMDMGFIHDLRRIISLIPEERQSLFFSATMPKSITELAGSILKDPVHVEVAREGTAADTVEQHMMFVRQADKKDLLVHLLKKPEVETVLIFMRTKHGADKVVQHLSRNDINAAAIHGNKSQPQRDRAMKAFKQGRLKILVATDIAARGIDVNNVSHVINFEIPNISETYVHRIGRTGRAGASGISWSLVNNEDERKHMGDIQRLMKRTVPVIEDHSWHLDLPEIPLDKARSGNRGQQGQSRGRGNRNSGGGGGKRWGGGGSRNSSGGRSGGGKSRYAKSFGKGRPSSGGKGGSQQGGGEPKKKYGNTSGRGSFGRNSQR